MMTPTDRPISVDVYTDLSDRRIDAWFAALEGASLRSNPFSMLWWARAGESMYREQHALVTLARDADGPLAAATLALLPTSRGKRLCALARHHRDLFDILAIRNCRAAAEAISDAIPWNSVHEVLLTGIPANSPLGPALFARAKQSGLRGTLYVNDGAPELSLHDDDDVRFENYRGIMRGKTSKQLRKRLAGTGNVHYTKATSKDKIPGLVDAVSWLHQKRWCGTPSPSYFGHRLLARLPYAIAEAAFEACALHLSVLSVDQQPVAAAMGYVLGKTYYYHMTAHDPEFGAYSPPAVPSWFTFLMIYFPPAP